MPKKIKKPKKAKRFRKLRKKSRTRAKLGAGPKLVKPPTKKLLVGGKPIEPPIFKTKIKIIGIGGGGSSIVSEIASEVKKVNFVVANTDQRALQTATRRAKHFQFGQRVTQGLGTGMNPELGEMAAQEEKERIRELLKGTDFCILVSCLGGGTGSGASPIFAEISRKLRNVTLGIFTLPFNFEGEKQTEVAKSSLEKLRQNLNALIIIPNQKIFQIIDKNTPLKEALSTINKALIENLEGLITLIYSSGLIRVDFADLKTILAGRGRLAYLNTVEAPIPSAEGRATGQAKSPNQIDPHTKQSYGVGVEEVAKRVLSNPLSPYSVQGAKEILFNIDGGLNLSLSQVEQIGKTISDSINPRARIAFGITSTPHHRWWGASKKGGIKITLLANGCQWERWEEEKKRSKKESKEKQIIITEVPKKSEKKIKKKLKEKPPEFPKVQQPEITQISTKEPEDYNPPTASSHSLRERAPVEIKVRKNALKMKESIEKEEKKMIAQERKWETPAFLRKTGQVDEYPKE